MDYITMALIMALGNIIGHLIGMAIDRKRKK